MPPDWRQARRKLQDSLRAARERELIAVTGTHPCAEAVDRARFRVAANALGLQAFTVHERAIDLQLTDRTLNLPVRADGKFEQGKQAIDGLTPMSRGYWTAPCQLTVEVDLVGKIDDYTLTMTFHGHAAEVEILERTGLMHETVKASVVQR